MEKIDEFLYGNDYSEKARKFDEEIKQIHLDYDGGFDTDDGYFIMQIITGTGKVKLSFDERKDIPSELRAEVLNAFKSIWK